MALTCIGSCCCCFFVRIHRRHSEHLMTSKNPSSSLMTRKADHSYSAKYALAVSGPSMVRRSSSLYAFGSTVSAPPTSSAPAHASTPALQRRHSTAQSPTNKDSLVMHSSAVKRAFVNSMLHHRSGSKDSASPKNLNAKGRSLSPSSHAAYDDPHLFSPSSRLNLGNDTSPSLMTDCWSEHTHEARGTSDIIVLATESGVCVTAARGGSAVLRHAARPSGGRLSSPAAAAARDDSSAVANVSTVPFSPAAASPVRLGSSPPLAPPLQSSPAAPRGASHFLTPPRPNVTFQDDGTAGQQHAGHSVDFLSAPSAIATSSEAQCAVGSSPTVPPLQPRVSPLRSASPHHNTVMPLSGRAARIAVSRGHSRESSANNLVYHVDPSVTAESNVAAAVARGRSISMTSLNSLSSVVPASSSSSSVHMLTSSQAAWQRLCDAAKAEFTPAELRAVTCDTLRRLMESYGIHHPQDVAHTEVQWALLQVEDGTQPTHTALPGATPQGNILAAKDGHSATRQASRSESSLHSFPIFSAAFGVNGTPNAAARRTPSPGNISSAPLFDSPAADYRHTRASPSPLQWRSTSWRSAALDPVQQSTSRRSAPDASNKSPPPHHLKILGQQLILALSSQHQHSTPNDWSALHPHDMDLRTTVPPKTVLGHRTLLAKEAVCSGNPNQRISTPSKKESCATTAHSMRVGATTVPASPRQQRFPVDNLTGGVFTSGSGYSVEKRELKAAAPTPDRRLVASIRTGIVDAHRPSPIV